MPFAVTYIIMITFTCAVVGVAAGLVLRERRRVRRQRPYATRALAALARGDRDRITTPRGYE